MPKRRADYGTGSVRYHRGGWELTVWVDGRRTTRRHLGPDTRKGRVAAEDALEALARSMRSDPDQLTLASAIARYERTGGPDWSPSTRASHRQHAARLIETLGDVPVADLRREQVQDVYDHWRATGTAAATVQRRHGILAAALHQLEGTVILRSPTDGVRIGRGGGDDAQALRLHDLPSPRRWSRRPTASTARPHPGPGGAPWAASLRRDGHCRPRHRVPAR